jgi:hypothetical protein
LALGAASAPGQDAGDFDQQGRKLLEAGKYPEAVAALKQAVALKPDSKRYRSRLSEAEALAARALIRKALEPGTAFVDQLGYLQEAETYSSTDDSVVSFRRATEEQLRKGRMLIREAREQLLAGSRNKAAGLVSRWSALSPWLPEIDELRSLMAPDVGRQAVLAAVAAGRFTQARATLAVWQARLLPEEFASIQSLVAERVGPEVEALINDSGRTSQPSVEDLELAKLAIEACSGESCGALVQTARVLESSYLRPLEPLIEASVAPGSVAHFARCQVFDRVARVLGQLRSPGNDLIGCSSEPPPLKVFLTSVGREDCALPAQVTGRDLLKADWSEAAGLPVELVSTEAEADAEVSVLLLSCETSVIQERNVQTRASTYRAGTQQINNPDYAAAQARVQSAQITRAAYPRSCGCLGECTPFVATLCLTTQTVALARAERELAATAPYLEREVVQPYHYQEYETGGANRIEALVVLKRPGANSFIAAEPVEANTQIVRSATRGVFPNDAQGLREVEARTPTQPELVAESLVQLWPKALRTAGGLLPRWLEYEGSRSSEEGKPLEALGHLARIPGSTWYQSLAEDPRFPEVLPLALASLPPSKGFETEISSVSPEVAVESAASATDLDGFLRSVVTLNTSTGSGSGFFVNATGAIVTNDHVVGTDLAVEVVTAGGDVFLGRVVARSAVHDLALVQIDSDQTPFLRLGTARGTRVGSRVFAMGSPSGLTGSASGGIVSAIRNLDFGLAVQTDAAINPGNSGGPLVTEDGVVIGVSTSFLKETQGIGFAVAAEVVRQVFEGQF